MLVRLLLLLLRLLLWSLVLFFEHMADMVVFSLVLLPTKIVICSLSTPHDSSEAIAIDDAEIYRDFLSL